MDLVQYALVGTCSYALYILKYFASNHTLVYSKHMHWSYLFTHSGGIIHSEDGRFCLSLESVLQFCTGVTCIPPLGFDSDPFIKFHHDAQVTLPTVNTCALTVTLPTAIMDVDLFKKRISYAIFNSVGFGNV